MSISRKHSYHTLPRLYSFFDINKDQVNLTEEQSHYLVNVMRLGIGKKIRIFNEGSGEYLASILAIKKKEVTIALEKQLRSMDSLQSSYPILAFGSIKKKALRVIVEKAVEIGVGTIQPLITENVHMQKIKPELLKRWSIEAAEQSERLHIPLNNPLMSLKKFLEQNKNQSIIWACERHEELLPDLKVRNLDQALSERKEPPIFLIGPEGGFSRKEVSLLENIPNITPVNLGEGVLRTETACLMMLSCYRSKL